MLVDMKRNEDSVLVVRRIILNTAKKVTERSNSFLSQQKVFEHCWNRPVRLVVEPSCLIFQLLVEMDRILVERINVARMEISKSVASF